MRIPKFIVLQIIQIVPVPVQIIHINIITGFKPVIIPIGHTDILYLVIKILSV